MPWNELLKIALLGTDRSPIGPALQQQLQALDINTDNDPATIVLQAAAILQAQKKVGTRLEKWQHPIPTLDKNSKENYCNSSATRHFQLILDGTHEAALPEFLQQMEIHNKTIAPAILPDLLEKALDDGELRTIIRPLIGELGTWLIQQNPKWTPHFSTPNLESWPADNLDTSIGIFETLRKSNPQQALGLIETDWLQLDTKHKAAYLQKMEIGLSQKDEPFLESCLNDSRKEVRQIATQLLRRLPTSELIDRMWQRAQMYIQFKKSIGSKGKPQITLPETIDETMIRDGIDPRHQWKSGGLKASRLGQIISFIPPQRWEQAYEKSPTELIQIFIRSDWAILFLQAFSHAAVLHKNQTWMTALLRFWINNYDQQRWQDFNANRLLEALSSESFDKMTLLTLKTNPNFSDEKAPLISLIRSSKYLWGKPLSKTLIRAFQKWMAQQTGSHWGSWHFRVVLKKAAYHCDISLNDELRKGWPTDAAVWSAWQRDIEQFFTTLQFRKDMITALREST